MRRRQFIQTATVATFGFTLADSALAAEKSSTGKSATLWMLPAMTSSQMNSFVIQTPSGKIIVIDGGTSGDTNYLRGFLAALGNKVDIWILSHPHQDHIDAATKIIEKPGKLQLGKFYGSFLDLELAKKVEPAEAHTLEEFLAAKKKNPIEYIEPEISDILEIDGIKIEFLGIKNPEIRKGAFNNSSIVFRMDVGDKRILFTGDLEHHGGQKILANCPHEKLKADIIQMAHHGQNGTSREFYEVVGAKECLWNTPLWLWNNDSGKGKGSGDWKTLEVRAWMEEMGTKNYLLFDGLQRFDLPI
jgi:beta-lactamase superfamily II metal-dependent hydrolase